MPLLDALRLCNCLMPLAPVWRAGSSRRHFSALHESANFTSLERKNISGSKIGRRCGCLPADRACQIARAAWPIAERTGTSP
jgi:hypothetical protein